MPLTVPMPDNVPVSIPPVDHSSAGRLQDWVASPQQFLDCLGNSVNIVQGLVLLALGLICLLQGWKFFKMVVVLNFACIGAGLGFWVGSQTQHSENMPLYCAIGGGLLLAVVSWPLMKYGVSAMGAMAGGLMGMVTWQTVAKALGNEHLAQNAWAGGLIGMILLGMLAFVLFRVAIVTFLSLQGAIMAVAGVLAIVLHYPPVGDPVQKAVTSHPHLLPIMILVPALIGFIFQETAAKKKIPNKKSESAPKPEHKG